MESMKANCKPEEIFEDDQLEAWARKNGFKRKDER